MTNLKDSFFFTSVHVVKANLSRSISSYIRKVKANVEITGI